MRSMWLGREIFPLEQQTAERRSCGNAATHSEHYLETLFASLNKNFKFGLTIKILFEFIGL